LHLADRDDDGAAAIPAQEARTEADTVPDASAFIASSVVLQQLHDEASTDHFTLRWLMGSLHKRSFGIIMLLSGRRCSARSGSAASGIPRPFGNPKKSLAIRSSGDSVPSMIRPHFLDPESRRDLIELARDGSAAHRLARRANALVLLDDGMRAAPVRAEYRADWRITRLCRRHRAPPKQANATLSLMKSPSCARY
jgi:hypothetical protein